MSAIGKKEKQKKHKKMNRREQSLHRVENFKKEVVTDLHIIPLEVLCTRLETNAKTGLSKARAKQRLLETGPNALTPSRKVPEAWKFIKNMVQGFSLLLWVGSLLCFSAVFFDYLLKRNFDEENFILGWVLIIIILVTGIFTYCQERKSSKIMASFADMIPQTATVIRGGEKMIVDVKELVVGDLVDLQFGDKIPADVRITKSQGFKVDNSSITGENEPLLRTNQVTNNDFLETRNIAFFSTNALEGTAEGIVIMCGDNTVMGRIAGLTARLHPVSTPIARELHRFMKIITIWACFLGAVFGLSSILMGYSWIDAALFIIGIIVANVPEGLAATVTVSLTVTAKKMAAKNCLVKNLEAVETLGSTSVICSDKTGTLTQNRMTVCHLWYNNTVSNADVSTDQYDAKRYTNDEGFRLLMRCATLCNRAEFVPDQEKKPVLQRLVIGDASEAAILKFVELTRYHGNPKTYREKHPKLIEIPFSSTTKYQVSVHGFDRECLLVMKGAPERLLDKCTTIYYNYETVKMTDELRALCDTSCLELAARGERVLGFCDLELKDTYSIAYPFSIEPLPNFPLDGLRFVGFMSLVDPPRPQVHDAVDRCRQAGIKVVMVTGDHPVTAKSIAKGVGIITADRVDEAAVQITPSEKTQEGARTAIVVPGNTLKELSPQELDHILYAYDEIIFARTSPTQKLQIVEGFQRIGMIVAVTGDGVNDAPALKKADIGIAMGISGSEVSKQSADMVLLDDNFASIMTGIEEGRKIFDNLKKSIVYILTSNIAELMPVLGFIMLNIPLPIGILAILCIDVLTDMMPAISLAYEKAETNIMLRPPRNPNKDNLVTFRLYYLAFGHMGIIEAYAGFFVYFMIMLEHGFKPNTLLGLRSEWDAKYINDLQDSLGREWTYRDRKELEYTCSTAYMMAVVICQWGNVIACKTRHNSIITQQMNNWILNASILFETLVAVMLSFLPFMNFLKFYPVKLRWCLYAVPFSGSLVLFDEYRKYCIRHYPNGYFFRETYY